MSRYNDEFINIDFPNKNKFPVTYHHIYHFQKKKLKKDTAILGLSVADFNTSSFYPSGHYKPISKIIDLTLFDTADVRDK